MSKTKKPLSQAKLIASGKIRHKSKTKGSVNLAWELFSKHRHLSRAECLKLADKAGIAFYTARTQYQAWRSAGKNDEEAAARSKQLMERIGLGKVSAKVG